MFKVDAVTKAIEQLGNDLGKGLFDSAAKVNGPLSEESDKKAAEAQTLRASHAQLQPRVEAQQRILNAEIDRAIAEGRDYDAEAKRRESAELQSNLGNILAQAEACERRVQELEAEQQRNYRLTFERAYPEIRESTVAVGIALAQLLDKVWDRILRFEAGSGLTSRGQSFVKTKHRLDLTPYESGPEARYFISLREWFGGRRI